jgi:hypothetical protein
MVLPQLQFSRVLNGDDSFVVRDEGRQDIQQRCFA